MKYEVYLADVVVLTARKIVRESSAFFSVPETLRVMYKHGDCLRNVYYSSRTYRAPFFDASQNND